MWIGNYDECANPLHQLNNKAFVQQPFDTQYRFSLGALLSDPNNDLRTSRSGLTLGLCLPASCTRQSIVTLVHKLFEFENFTDAYLHCSNDRVNEHNGFSAGTIAISVVLTLLTLVVLIGTIIDLTVHLYRNKYKDAKVHIQGYDDLSDKNLVLTSTYQSLIEQMPLMMFLAEFSAICTLKHIFTIKKIEKENMFTCINGIRVLSLFWVIFGHSFSFDIVYLSNVYDLLAASRSIAFQLITSGVLSGFLTATLFVRQVRKEKLTFRMMVLYYIHRYLRLKHRFY